MGIRNTIRNVQRYFKQVAFDRTLFGREQINDDGAFSRPALTIRRRVVIFIRFLFTGQRGKGRRVVYSTINIFLLFCRRALSKQLVKAPDLVAL